VRFFFEKFKHGDANDMEYQTTLIDTFVNVIYLYDGEDIRIEIYCNASDRYIRSPIADPDINTDSVMGQLPIWYNNAKLINPAI